MKHFLTVCVMLVAVFFAAMLSTSLTAANAARITVTSIKTVNSVSKTRNKITPANDSHRAFVAAELTRSVGTGGGEYGFVVWTESAIDEAARRELINAISGELKNINQSGVLFVSGDPHTWSESQGSKKTLSFNHDMFSLSDRSVIRRFAYGSYVAGAAQPSETAATTEITATTQTTTTTTTTTTAAPRPTITISQVTLPTQLEPPATATTAATTATNTTTTAAPRPTITISQVTLPTQLEPPVTVTATATTTAATTAQTTNATETTTILSTVTVPSPTQATQPPQQPPEAPPENGEDPPGTTVSQTRPSTTAPAANRFPASGGE